MSDGTTAADFDPTAYWERRLAARYTLGSTGWASLGESFNRWSYAVRGVAFRRIARTALNGRASPAVLDVGSGTGFYLDLWARLGAREITGCDLTTAAVERLERRFPRATIRRVDIGDAQVPLPPGSYDAISIMDVLYHIVDDQRYAQALRNLAQLLKADGTLILTENFVTRNARGEHQVSRARGEIDRMLADAGLVPVCQRPLFVLMNTPVASDSRLLHSWWSLLTRLIVRHDAIGWIAGAALTPIEIALGRLAERAPSTAIVACRLAEASRLPGPAAHR